MDARRYRAYRAVRSAVTNHAVDDHASLLLEDRAEALLLARDAVEGEEARDSVPDALAMLVDDGHLSAYSANRIWVLMKACGPKMTWPPTWIREPFSHGPDAVRDA